jgi:hypothetical protein
MRRAVVVIRVSRGRKLGRQAQTIAIPTCTADQSSALEKSTFWLPGAYPRMTRTIPVTMTLGLH